MLSTVMQEVRDRLHGGEPFERVEAFIEYAPGLTDEERAALWLLAWSDGDLQAMSFDLGRSHDLVVCD
jgi:hypothetical protein